MLIQIKMRLLFLVPLLAATVCARPQASPASDSDWKPVPVADTEPQPLRDEDQETRTYKTDSNSALKESVQQLTNQLKPNRTIFTMDTRTPPKIRFQQKNIEKKKAETPPVENSHPGIAVPVDVDTFLESSTQTQKRIIYRSETKAPTPDSGISTWILLSGQSTTSKPVRKQPAIKMTTSAITTIEPEVNKTTVLTEKPIKGTIKIKPLTTRKIKTTTPIPTTITTKNVVTTTTAATTAAKITTETIKTTEKKPDNNRLMTKIKASVLNNAVKNKTVTASTTISPTPTTISSTTVITKQKTTKPENKTGTNTTVSENTENNELQPEAKDGGIELSEKSATTTKRPRRPANKRKKNNNNKNRRRKPTNETVTASEKIDTALSTNTTKPHKEKPIGTQIYNYLSREIMPTVGVGLVGLMVTAGLASYFLYPFGGLRRTFDGATDRKDYYYDEYAAGGMAEEELIGKVIAGMPEQHDYNSNSYRTHLARKDAYKNEINYNYRNADHFYPNYPTNNNNNNEFHTVSIGSKIGYGRDVVAEHQKESGYTVDDGELEKNQFVVGNIPKEFEPVTPDPVPEHGPRNLRVRRFAQNDKDNEIDFKYEEPSGIVHPYYVQKVSSTQATSEKSAMIESTEKSTESTVLLQPEQPNFFSFLRNLIELKVRLGLDFLLRTTDSFSNYLKGVQSRVNNALKEENTRTPPR